jgi:hypothetical protein
VVRRDSRPLRPSQGRAEAGVVHAAQHLKWEEMNEGLVAPSWSDSGDVPVGQAKEMTVGQVRFVYLADDRWSMGVIGSDYSMEVRLEPMPEIRPSDPNAKPSNPALCRVAGEAYRGLGWCDE